MKAFLIGVGLMVVITLVTAVGLNFVPMSASDVFTERGNVRL